MYTQYNAYISSDFSDDYWSDEGVSHGARLIASFTEADWIDLERDAALKPSIWAIRCAETLGDICTNNSMKILVGLLKSSDSEVQIAALDSINSLYAMGFAVSTEKDELRNAIHRLKDSSSGGIARFMLASLEAKLQ